jgi:hypothetical protein
MKTTILLTTLILCLSIFGGMQVYTNPVITVGLVAAGWVTIALSFRFWGNSPVWGAVWPLSLALLASFLANLDISQVGAARVWLAALALAVLFVTNRLVTPGQLLDSLSLAGWLWPALWLLLRPGDNANIVAVWPVTFFLVSLWRAGQEDSYLEGAKVGIYCLILLYLGSRGAILGLAAGVVALYASRLTSRLTLCAGGVLLGLLILWRPETALFRLHYWQQALTVFLANPVLGVGPGGLWARHLISEPGGFQLHAHNFIFSSMAELGLGGLLALLYAGWRIYVLRSTFNLQPYQLAIITALLVHSLVDEPLFWPGILLLAAIIVGTIKYNEVR